VLRGYRRVVVDGQEKFCRNDPMTDSRVQSAVICLTREEIENQHRGPMRPLKNILLNSS